MAKLNGHMKKKKKKWNFSGKEEKNPFFKMITHFFEKNIMI